MSMTAFLLRRVALALATLLGITLLTFVLLRLAPGDPAAAVLSDSADNSRVDYDALRHAYGLDEPVPLQYVRWLGRLLAGDFGHSIISNRPVGDLVGAALPNTLELSLLALVVSLGFGIPLGVLAA